MDLLEKQLLGFFFNTRGDGFVKRWVYYYHYFGEAHDWTTMDSENL